ncbi:MAG: hypothetical protein QOJ56_6671, partial [Mycobacterium sp.]|nr:hypothetical protein [Mycobacterium sp.]
RPAEERDHQLQPDDDAGRYGPLRSGIINFSPTTMRAGTAR